MSKAEFAKIMLILKAAYPSGNLIPDDYTRNFWYEMLKDLDYGCVMEAVEKHIQSSRFLPTIAELREYSGEVWSTEWVKLLRGGKMSDLNEAGRYAFQIISRKCFESCLVNSEKLMQCMRHFESLYKEYAKISERDKKSFMTLLEVAKPPQIECEEGVGDEW